MTEQDHTEGDIDLEYTLKVLHDENDRLESQLAEKDKERDEFAIGVLRMVLNKIWDNTNMPAKRPTEEEFIKAVDLYKQSLGINK
jgi:hypothetical protein